VARSFERPPERAFERSSERSSRSPSTYGAGPIGRREKVDPWFAKPYEPAKSVAPVASSAPPAKPKHKLAALLGGLLKH
jgi:hypothetical protein